MNTVEVSQSTNDNYYYDDLCSLIEKFPQFVNSINESYLKLLSHLTESPPLENDVFLQQINKIYNNNSKIFIKYFNIPSNENFTIIGSVTCFLEPKIIRNARFSAHIEDVVVHKDFRNKGIANYLIKQAIEYANQNNCYKIILDCDEKLIPFYNKFGFFEKGRYLTLYL